MLGQRPRTGSPYRYSIITHQHYQVLSHFGPRQCPADCAALSVSVPAAEWRRSLHGSCWMAAFLQKFKMKTSIFLLFFGAFTCGLAQVEENAAEELQVETLVSVWYSITAALIY